MDTTTTPPIRPTKRGRSSWKPKIHRSIRIGGQLAPACRMHIRLTTEWEPAEGEEITCDACRGGGPTWR